MSTVVSVNPDGPTVPAPLHASAGGLAQVNLLPEAARIRLVRRRRGRAWVGVVLATAALAALGWQWSTRYADEADAARTALAEAHQRVRRAEKHGISIAARTQLLRNQLATYEAMRADGSWAHDLALLARAVPPGAALSGLEVLPATARDARRENGRDETGVAGVSGEHEVRLEGYAPDHAVLAKLIRGLQETSKCKQVRLLRSVSEPVGSDVMLSFAVSFRR